METVAHATNVQDLLVDVPVARAQPEVRRRPMFTGLEDHSISFEDAQALIRNYGETAGPNAIKGGFFGRFGFKVVDKSQLPHKVWGDCMKCVKFPDCDEIAMILDL